MVAIVVASSRRGDAEQPHDVWNDALLCVASAALYAREVDLIWAWKGPCPPPPMAVPHARARLVEQPEWTASYGEAFGWAVAQTDADELILLNDDAVLTPTTVAHLLEDAALIRDRHPEIELGFLACRSNSIAGAQNVRASNGGALLPDFNGYESEGKIIPADRISPVAAYISRQALDTIGGFPPLNWFSDDLMCWDLLRAGYRNFISRAYVHHVGERTTKSGGRDARQLVDEAHAWIRENRPDFWDVLR